MLIKNNKMNTLPTFTINEYDSDGDCIENGIYIHFDNTRIKMGESLKDFKELLSHLQKIYDEISENY